VLYLLVGIGILVEILRRLGLSFVTVRTPERKSRVARNADRAPNGESERPR
jgi:hypothetical protein